MQRCDTGHFCLGFGDSCSVAARGLEDLFGLEEIGCPKLAVAPDPTMQGSMRGVLIAFQSHERFRSLYPLVSKVPVVEIRVSDSKQVSISPETGVLQR